MTSPIEELIPPIEESKPSAEEKADEEKARETKAQEEKLEEERAAALKAEEEKAQEEKTKEVRAKEIKAEEEKAQEVKAKEEKAREEKAAEEKAQEEKVKEEAAEAVKAKEEKLEEEAKAAGTGGSVSFLLAHELLERRSARQCAAGTELGCGRDRVRSGNRGGRSRTKRSAAHQHDRWSVPVYTVPADQPTVKVTLEKPTGAKGRAAVGVGRGSFACGRAAGGGHR